jgi:amino acid permease
VAIDHLNAGGTTTVTAQTEDSEPLTWAAKWDVWTQRVLAAGCAVLTLTEFFHLEQTVWASTWDVKLMIAVPLLLVASMFHTVWKARREKRMEKQLTDQLLTSILLIAGFTYSGMVGLLRHFCH